MSRSHQDVAFVGSLRLLGGPVTLTLWDADPDRPPGWGLEQRWGQRLFHSFARGLSRLWLTYANGLRHFHPERVPTRGGVLVVANHQSFYDPVAVGAGLPRMGNYMARDSLFAWPWAKKVLSLLTAYPVRRGSADLKALRETIRRLKQGRMVVMFPEGTRTPTGDMEPLQGGFVLLARRAGVPIVPAAVEGAFAVWPRHRKLPRLGGSICVSYGEPITTDTIAELSDDQVAELVYRAILKLQLEMRQQLARQAGR